MYPPVLAPLRDHSYRQQINAAPALVFPLPCPQRERPQAHAEFLAGLNIAGEEIEAIREWSRQYRAAT